MSNAGEFIRIFNELSAHLVSFTGEDLGRPFSRLVDQAAQRSATVAKHSSRLKTFGKLRNAIVHHEGYPPEVVAEPVDSALAEFVAIAAEVKNPGLVMPRFARHVECFSSNDWLIGVLQYMRENNYSQVAVRDGGRLRLLTTEGVARYAAEWTPMEPERLQHATISDALKYDLPDGFLILSASQTVDYARDAFATELSRGQVRLYALLITQSGDPTEEPIGIITPWDFLVPQHV